MMSAALWETSASLVWTRPGEKTGNYPTAVKLLFKRKAAVLTGEKLPEHKRARVQFATLCADALTHSRSENSPKQTYGLSTRIATISEEWGSRPAESIKKADLVGWLDREYEARDWKAPTRNRWQATFSLIFRVGIDNEKLDRNPVASIRRKTENNDRVRYLSVEEEDGYSRPRSSSGSLSSCPTFACPSILG